MESASGRDIGHGTQSPDANRRPEIFHTKFEEYTFVSVATIAVAMSSFFQGATTVTTASITAGLHMSASELPWCTGANALTSGAFLLTFGRLADIVDRRVMLTISIASFAVLTLVAAFSPSGTFFILVKALLGLCGAAAITPATGLLGSIYRAGSRRKNLVFSIYGAGAPMGFVLGSISAGVTTQVGSWRTTYMVMAVIFSLAAATSWFATPEQRNTNQSGRARWNELRKIDAIGSTLIVVGLGMVSAAFTLAPTAPRGWESVYVLVLLILGLSVMAAFGFWQIYAEAPLLPVNMFKDQTFTLLMVVSTLGFASFNSAQFWLSLYLQQVKSLSPLMVAVQLVPQAVAGVFFNLTCGLIMHAVRNEILMIIGAMCYTGAALMLTFLRPDITYWALIFPSLLLMVVGIDFQFNIANVYSVSSFPLEQQALASGVFNTLMRISVNFGLGLSSAAHTGTRDPTWKPFRRSFYVSVGLAGSSLMMGFFLRIGKQGLIATEKDQSETNPSPAHQVGNDSLAQVKE